MDQSCFLALNENHIDKYIALMDLQKRIPMLRCHLDIFVVKQRVQPCVLIVLESRTKRAWPWQGGSVHALGRQDRRHWRWDVWHLQDLCL
jgi:hypothetical protein